VGSPVRPGALSLAVLAALGLLGAWTWLALAWSTDSDQTVLEGLRLLLYVAVAVTLVLVVRRDAVEPLLAGALTGIFVPAAYGLATRLFPDRLGVFDPIAGYRLQEPIGYWNALGAFAAMGALLALGFAARGSVLARVLAATALPVLLATLYFTFSRGAWIALAVGLAFVLTADPRRLQLVAAGLVLAPASALAVWLASRQDALARVDAPLAEATAEGHRLALYILLLSALSGVVAAAFWILESRVAPPRPLRLAFGGALALVVVVGLVTIFARYGGPVTIVGNAWDSFSTTKIGPQPDLRERLFTFQGSYRVELWEAALDQYVDHRALGSGPGTYEQYWNEHRPFWHIVRDAHNLYLEVLAELGPVGLLLLAFALGVPFAAALLARGQPLVPAAGGAFAVFVVHAAVDWDWELPAVTVAGLACAIAVTAAAAKGEPRLLGPRVRWSAVAVALGLAAVSFVGLVGASALSASEEAADKGRWEEAEKEARKAARWWRWSPEPWTRLGQAQLGAGDSEGAVESFRRAVSKDRDDWELWYDLYLVTEGRESSRALAEAARLNRFFRSDLEEGDTRAPG
jgi:tetratricopeptide (TPR) repeat protein